MELEPEDSRLLSLATSIAGDNAVDWQAVEQELADAEASSVVSELRLLHTIASFHHERAHEDASVSAPQTWGKFTIVGQIGRGAFGVVYRAYDAGLEQEIALKLLPSGDRAIDATRILKEARMLARVRHPNVVIVFGVDRDQDQVGLWMEFVKGRTLDDLVKTHGPFSAREAAVIGLDLCRAVAAVHAAGLLHGDIKAHNIMREEGGRIVLMDFGAGRELREHVGDDFAGTPAYLAPEVFDGQPRTRAADVYSLGVLLYFLVTGRYPVAGATRSAVARTHQSLERTALRDARPDLPDAFIQCVDRAMEHEPSRRYDSAGEFGAALARSLGLADAEWQGAPPSQGRAGFSVSRLPMRWLFIAAAVLLVGGPMAWMVSRGRSGATDLAADANLLTSSSTGFGGAAPGASARAAADRSYRVDAALYRKAAEPQRLSSGSRLAPGDQLYLNLEVSVPAYVYVINEDDHGESYLLFPLPGQDVTNPLPASTKHRLPGVVGQQETYWQVTSAGEHEHFLIFASPERLTAFESALSALPRPEVGRPILSARVPSSAAQLLRGVGGLAAAPDSRASGSRLSGQFITPLAQAEETTNGVWVRQLTLENPGR